MYRLVSVSKSYGSSEALTDVSINVEPARTTVLIGPSGSGKSTVLGVMTGLLKPDAGALFFEDAPVTDQRLQEIRRRIGYVIQDGGLFPHLTAGANVTLMARYLSWPGEKIRARVDELLSLVRLSPDLLTRYPAELSGGQRQRFSLMRALMLDADLLLLDEPLGSLDPMVRAELQEDLTAIFRRLQKTVVLVTHDLAEAAFFADRVILMRSGRIVQEGSISDLYKHPAEDFVRRFVQAQAGAVPIGAQS